MAAPLTEAAIQRVRDMIASGELGPGSRLPPEAELAAQLGASRNTVREAVRALITTRVLDVRRGDGTFVTSLRPELLLAGIGAATELFQEGFSLELIGVRRILEPAATAMAAVRIDAAALAALATCLESMRTAGSEEELLRYDTEFHARVAASAGNETLASMLGGLSSRTLRARVWRGVLEEDSTARTVAQHADILEALQARDPVRAQAAALVHVATTEAWFRRVLGEAGVPLGPGPEARRPRRARSAVGAGGDRSSVGG